jgi:RING finger protein 113A
MDPGPSATGQQESPAAEAARAAASSIPAAAIFSKRKNRGTLRKRGGEGEGEGDAADVEDAVVKKVQRQKEAPLAFSTRREDKTELFRFESSNTVQQQQGDAFATRQLETETAHDRDGRALREKVLAAAAVPGKESEAAEAAGQQPDNVYKGLHGYKDYRAGFRREQTIGAEKGAGSHGPLRASTNVRMTVRIDYQPDICKDYKETGYCGFGDSCKFLHDRGDYKAGWELDRVSVCVCARRGEGGAGGTCMPVLYLWNCG